MRRILPAALSLLAFAAAAAEPNRFSLVRSDSGDAAEAGVFSLDDATLRLACAEEQPDAVPDGATPPVAVLCHGLGSAKENPLFDALSKALRARGVAVARFDFNGHGASEGPFERMTVSNEVLDVETVMDYYRNVRGARAALVGHSQGGVVAALAAARLGSGSVDALVLLAPAAVLREDALRGRVLDAVFDPLDPPETVPVLDGRFRLGRDYILDAQETDPYPAAASFGGPLLVVHGQADTVVPWTCGQRFVDARPGQGELVLVRPAGHDFKGWEDTVAGVVANFVAKSFGLSVAEEPAPVETPAPVEETPAPIEEVPTPVEEAPAPVEALPAAPAQSVPVELPPDIRGDMRSFLDALDTQASVEPAPAVPADESHAESAEVAEPVPVVESHAESAEVAELDLVDNGATGGNGEQSAEGGSGEAEPPPVETHAEPAPVAGGEAAITESTPAALPPAVDSLQVSVAEPPAVDSIQTLAAAYPALPIPPNGSVINILAAPNGLTWQGLEVEEEDMLERIRIFGKSIPEANVRIQAFAETPAALVKRLVDAARDAGFTKVSVVLPSAR